MSRHRADPDTWLTTEGLALYTEWAGAEPPRPRCTCGGYWVGDECADQHTARGVWFDLAGAPALLGGLLRRVLVRHR